MRSLDPHKIAVFMAVLVIAVLQIGVPRGLADPPKAVSLSAYGAGSQAFVIASGLAEGVWKTAGIRTRVIPAGNDVGRILPLKEGEVEFCMAAGSTGWFTSHGTGDFAAPDWGPQPLRMAWRGADVFLGYYTRGDSEIRNFRDLRGKRIAQTPGSPALNHLIQGALAFGDLTLEDCRVLRLPGHGAAARALTQGAIDFYAFGTTGSLPAETASGRHGLRWLDMSPENQAGWRRYEEVCPWTVMGLVQRYIGRDDGVDPFHSVRYPYNIWCWDNTAEELVYAYAKAIWDSYESYRDKHAELAHWTHETLADTESCYAPYHPGVVRLMKEEGVWTPSHERFQKTRLRQETERMALWKRTRKAASRQGIDFHSVEWKETWWKALTAAGLLR